VVQYQENSLQLRLQTSLHAHLSSPRFDRTQRNTTTSSRRKSNTLPAYVFMVADGCSDIPWMGLSKLIGSFSGRFEHGLVNTLVDDETVANCIVVDLIRNQLSEG
jgi:hypothetical protein